MLELEVVPERSLGCEQWEFILGMHFSQAVAIIQSQVGIIKGVQVVYSESTPLTSDLVINLSQDGVRLVFDPVCQRLKIIEVYNMKQIRLKYCGNVFNSPEVIPSIEQIEHSFGATHPGVYDRDKHIFQLNFRGLNFSFPVDSKFTPGYAHGLGSLQFPNGASPVVSRTSVFGGLSLTECKAPAMPIACYHGLPYLEHAQVLRERNRTKGLRLHIYTEGPSRYLEPKKQMLTQELRLGDSCEDVVTALGSPPRMFYKSEDKMKIHSPNAARRGELRSDFFFNYFTLGIDVLFDAVTQRVKKIIMHTNYPGHYNFNIYHRCEFRIELKGTGKGSASEVTAYTKWSEISDLVRKTDRPVVLNRASTTNTTNPFGSTFCYPYQDLIFEVMGNEHIASVTMYVPERRVAEV